MKVADLLQVKLIPNSISTSHRLKTKRKSDFPPIIVRFVSRDIKNKIYNNRKHAKNADFSKLSIQGMEKVYVNENLTHLRKNLFWETKQQAKKAGFKFYWTIINGNIFVRKCESTDPILISDENDLELIKWKMYPIGNIMITLSVYDILFCSW